MAKFIVVVTELEIRTVEVEAKTKDEAEELAVDGYGHTVNVKRGSVRTVAHSHKKEE